MSATTIVPPPTTVVAAPSPNSSTASAGDDGTSTSEAISILSRSAAGYDCCLPPMPPCFGSTPWITTWMCSGAAPLDSASAFVSASIIFGTDSSVTRRSYSLTSIIGTGLPPSARPARQRARPYGLSAQCDIVVPFLQRYRPTGHGTGRHREQHRAPRDRRR